MSLRSLCPNAELVGNDGFNTILTSRFLSLPAKRQDEDYDEQVEETLQDEVNMRRAPGGFIVPASLSDLQFIYSISPKQDENDVYILTKVSDILHSVFSSYKEKVLPWFEQLLQLIVQLIVSISELRHV